MTREAVAWPVSILAVALATGTCLGQKRSAIRRDGACWLQTVEGDLLFAGAKRFRIVADGGVSLRGGAAGTVVYSVTTRVRARSAVQAGAALAAFGVKSKVQGDWVLLTFTVPNLEGAADVTATVPREALLAWIETRGGNTQASGLGGDVRIDAAGGRIDLDEIHGRSEIRTAGGDVSIGRVDGAVRCFTGAGKIQVNHVGGESRFETAGGDIFVEEAVGSLYASTGGGNIHVNRCGSTVEARTAAGLIEVQRAGGAVTADTSGGAIEINASHGASCDSAAGEIRLRQVSGSLHASATIGSIFAELLGGRLLQDSVLRTSKGDITVSIPSNLALTVVARNESSGQINRIVSDFPEIKTQLADPGRRRPFLAEGSLNGGGPVLRIAAAGGTIYLRRQR